VGEGCGEGGGLRGVGGYVDGNKKCGGPEGGGECSAGFFVDIEEGDTPVLLDEARCEGEADAGLVGIRVVVGGDGDGVFRGYLPLRR